MMCEDIPNQSVAPYLCWQFAVFLQRRRRLAATGRCLFVCWAVSLVEEARHSFPPSLLPSCPCLRTLEEARGAEGISAVVTLRCIPDGIVLTWNGTKQNTCKPLGSEIK